MKAQKKKFRWNAYPLTEDEFEALMSAIDRELDSRGLRPDQRPMHVGRLLWEALGWGGAVFPDRALAGEGGYQGDVLMAKALRWYDTLFENQIQNDAMFSRMPVKLGNAIWRVRIPVIYGQCLFFLNRDLTDQGDDGIGRVDGASANMLASVEGLSQALADRLPMTELERFKNEFQTGCIALMWRDALPRDDLFVMARNDYDSATSDLLGRRYNQAMWGAQQAVEKTIKGLLQRVHVKYPTGKDGHDLPVLAGKLFESTGIALDPKVTGQAACSTSVRYGTQQGTEREALAANHAVLAIVKSLSQDATANSITKT
ncbi:HEPN domain-containing protein [Variovorax sp. LjRoot84]|uniref:HEPN domain-containing protein n=1 Tax=Variovorax sp. LjRoot84 TaxID=3342340 RepID=UPI003ECD7199